EKRLGEIIYDQLRGQTAVLNDPLIHEYINSLGNRLVAHSQDVKFPFTFFTINSPDINAFAFYGGHIGVHTGLIATAETESQLASVLAHEIAHVTQRHLARRKQAASQQSNMTLAGIVGSILLAAVNPQAMIGALMATTASAQQSMINYTRGNEQEADNIGMNVLATAGFDPYASAEFFAKLQEQQRYKTKQFPFLVTHPLADSRVTDARLRAQQYEKRFYADSLDFLLINARILARYIYDKDQAVELFQEKVKQERGNKLYAAKYGLALAYLDRDELKASEKILKELDELSPNSLYVLDALSDVHIGKKQPEKYLEKLAYAYQLRPNNSVVTLNYANVLLEAKKTDKATQILEYYLLSKPNDYLAMQLLRSAYKQAEKTARYHTTSAELAALRADYRAAIQSVDLALMSMTSDDKAEVARLEALKIEYRTRQRYIKNIKGV
ncbi:MAG: M48 family metallopeptidase, partial [Gammaproteobacteria bacterium]|nr:M48 family metallopeptidase [Gammaproteobacteria bacterium]